MKRTLLHRISWDADTILYGHSLTKGTWTAGMSSMEIGRI